MRESPTSSPTPDSPSPRETGSSARLLRLSAVALLAMTALGGLWFLNEADTVTETYKTLAEAEKHLEPDHIPPILPPSARDFSVKWDSEDVVGTFQFNPKEIKLFLAAGAEEVEPHGAAREISPGLDAPEEIFLKYQDDDTVWTIVVSETGEGGYRSGL